MVVGMSSGKRKGVGRGGVQPGPIYDNAFRLLFAEAPECFAAFVTNRDLSSVRGAVHRSVELAGVKLTVDALISVGDERFHIEIQTRADRGNIEPRLAEYASRLVSDVLPPIAQFVIVLRPGKGQLSGVFRHGGLTLRYTPIHIWKVPAEDLLADSGLYPLAVLGKPPLGSDRVAVLEASIGRSLELADRDQGIRHIQVAATLARIHLSTSTINQVLERTTQMTLSLKEIIETEIYEQGRDQGLEQGLQQGLEQGLQQGKLGERQLLVTFAELRFGRLPDNLRTSLTKSSGDSKLLSQQIMDASDLVDLGRRLAALEA